MTKPSIYVLIFISLTIFASYGCGRKNTNNMVKQETPKALQDSKLDLISYSRSGTDLVEELYLELAVKSPALKKLEEELDANNNKLNDVNDLFNKYNNKSVSYYNSAGNMANSITDSLLRKKMASIIQTSKAGYSKKTAELNNLLDIIASNRASLNDIHSVLKIVLTMPEIEKYQSDKLPGDKEFKDLIREQEKLIEQTNKLIPEY
jgi:hypothetical protein